MAMPRKRGHGIEKGLPSKSLAEKKQKKHNDSGTKGENN
jgi:hypothetical protein